MKKGTGKNPECHPNRKHYAKGLCASCYHSQAKKKQHKQPVRVTHTHEIIRQVQQEKPKDGTWGIKQEYFEKVYPQQERKHTMAAHENDKPKAKDAPKAVTSPAGTTEPTIELGGDGITPKAEFDEKYAELKKKQDAHDEKRRQQAREDAGVMITTAKGV